MSFQKPIDTLDDLELIHEITKTNNTHLFGILYDRYAAIVYNKCLGFIGSKEEAQDVTHDIFVKLFVKLKSFKGEAKFSTWLYSFTYNHCVNYLQREIRGSKNTFSVEEEKIEEKLTEEIDDARIFEMKAENLNQALKEISPNERAILLMKYQDDLSIKEIAQLNELGESAVKMRLNRAKINLIKIYNQL
ncbi:MAG TPA: RNA polymerase sigma factor [Moheibacter sp.]|nr:RNA polymerase sigma factor [Moheibacter sp.]